MDISRLAAMLLVMSIHSPFEGDLGGSPIAFIVRFLSNGAVPMFFMLSGYLGARRLDSPGTGFGKYVQDKFWRLAVPFLFWNLLILLLVFLTTALGRDSALRGNGAYFGLQPSVASIGAALFGIGRCPIVYQFWFLRDLIVVSLLGFAIVRWVPTIPLLPWLLLLAPWPMASSLGFFLAGRQLHSLMPPECFPEARSSALFCGCWILFAAGTAAGNVEVPQPLQALGSAAFIFMAAAVASSLPFAGRLAALGSTVFFVYATHEPTQTILVRAWQALHLPAFGTTFCFLTIPAIVFPLCATAYLMLRKMAPRFAALITGGR